MTVIVIAGGLSHEREVSLRSGRRVAAALRQAGHEVLETDVTPELLELVGQHPGAVLVPMLHGGLGEDGALREVFDVIGAKYVGSDGESSRMTFDKATAHTVVKHAGIRVPRQAALSQEAFRELGAQTIMQGITEYFGYPLIVKPSRSGSALGVTRIEDPDAFPAALVAAYAYGPVAVVEQCIQGTEVAVTVIDEGEGPVALPAVEIRAVGGIYDYEARYTAGATRFVTPAELPVDVLERVEETAVAAHTALGQRHFSRVDIIVTAEGEPVFIEGNVAPGMTETSLTPLAFEAGGRTIGDVFSKLVSLAR